MMRRIKTQSAKVSRREFLTAVATVGGGVLIGYTPRLALGQDSEAKPSLDINPYLRIDADNVITVLSSQMEGGQGSYTGIATLIAEELDASWDQLKVEGAAGDTAHYGNLAWGGVAQGTGGSTSMVTSWDRYRQIGAAAREMLKAAAAARWGVAPQGVILQAGQLHHPGFEPITYGSVAADAASLSPPKDAKPKTPSAWTHIGKENRPRLDTAKKSRGQQDYTIDVDLPGMLTAVLARPPRFGAKVKRFNAASAKSIPGVVSVLETPRGVAVLARDFWTAKKGRDQLEVEWDETGAERRSTEDLKAAYRSNAGGAKRAPVRVVGNTENAMATADQVLESTFDFPYLAHAAMEPLNAVAQFKNGRLEIWAGHQLPDLYQYVAAEIMGIPVNRVTLHVMMTGGFFGRRATPDSDVIVEVVSLVKSLGDETPVRVQWTREDDMTGGRYRPLYHHAVKVGLDSKGMPLAWEHKIVGQSIIGGTPFEGLLVHNGIDSTSVEGIEDLPYQTPNLNVELATTDVGVPVLWWRSVGHTHTGYAVECMIDHLAAAARLDPVAYRRELLQQHPRRLGVLNLAAEKAGWEKPLRNGDGRGIAVHKSFDTYVAQVAEISIQNGTVRVNRVICAVDCGVAINPDVVRSQIEGGVGFALSALLTGKITLEDGVVKQNNFDTYPVLRINEMPTIEVHIVPSTESPTGVGEPGVPPLAPAVANAILNATGKTLNELPIGNQLKG